MPLVQKFEIAKVSKLRQKTTKTNYEKVRSYYPASPRHRIDVERLRYVEMCTLFLFKEIKDARLFSNS